VQNISNDVFLVRKPNSRKPTDLRGLIKMPNQNCAAIAKNIF
jgi:aspartate carbamoyltransferase regulatory subunit